MSQLVLGKIFFFLGMNAQSWFQEKKATPLWYQTYCGMPYVGISTAVIRLVLCLFK